MAFTASHAYDLLRSAFEQGRMPHALLIVGSEASGAYELCHRLISLINPATRGGDLEHLTDEYCRIVRPRSKTRRILIEDIRTIEPFLRQKAALDRWKVAVFMDAERMGEEPANAFLKTLEEPPSHSLIILVSSKPDQLLQTILSRCITVQLHHPEEEVKLTELQQAILPSWAEACRNIGSDLTALSFRSTFLKILSEHKEALSKSMNQALKEENKIALQGTESKLESQSKEYMTALIETEYLLHRDAVIDLFILWFGQAALVASGQQPPHLIHPDILTMSQSTPINDIIHRLTAIENMKNDLRFNVQEALCIDHGMIGALGKCDLSS